MDDARLAVVRHDAEASDWLRRALNMSLYEALKSERQYRKRSGTPAMVLASLALAEAQKDAAEAYGRALAKLDAKEAG